MPATELAALVRDEILAKGAKRVAVMTLPDSAATPYGSTLTDDGRALLTGLSAAFNAALLAGLDGSGARIIDARALNATVQASPGSFGLTNITTPACAVSSSLLCNAAPAALFTAAGLPNLNNLNPGASASTYLFADGVHPTDAGHEYMAEKIAPLIGAHLPVRL